VPQEIKLPELERGCCDVHYSCTINGIGYGWRFRTPSEVSEAAQVVDFTVHVTYQPQHTYQSVEPCTYIGMDRIDEPSYSTHTDGLNIEQDGEAVIRDIRKLQQFKAELEENHGRTH